MITIKKAVRIPGEKAKVAVDSYDDRIDPVGACVGMKGSRIHGIVRELGNENIDVINYTNNTQLYITRALSPAKVNSLNIDEEKKTVQVYLNPDEVSRAIGKGGHNIRLAGRLLDMKLMFTEKVLKKMLNLQNLKMKLMHGLLKNLEKLDLILPKVFWN